MQRDRLTQKQNRLVQELKDIYAHFNLDYYNIHSYERDERIPYLNAARDKVVRGQVIIWYTVVDDLLTNVICRYYFGKRRSFPELWRTKKFQNFNYYVIEELHLMQKLRHVKVIRKIPKSIAADIERLNSLRNALAHALFPENLRKSSPQWKGENIFSLKGLKLLQQDFYKIINFLIGSNISPQSTPEDGVAEL